MSDNKLNKKINHNLKNFQKKFFDKNFPRKNKNINSVKNKEICI